jgi:Collagen triple helix repeat (20 copies)
MPPLSDKQKKRLEKLSKVLDGGEIAIVQQIAEVEDRLDEVASQIPALRQAVDGVDGEKGEKGDTGAPGAEGRPGRDGKDGRDGIDGKDGKNGLDGLVGPQGEPGKDGKDGANGKDGFIDVATIGYLEEEIKKLDKKHGGYGQVIRELRAGTNVTIDNSNMEYPVINATGGEVLVHGVQ